MLLTDLRFLRVKDLSAEAQINQTSVGRLSFSDVLKEPSAGGQSRGGEKQQ